MNKPKNAPKRQTKKKEQSSYDLLRLSCLTKEISTLLITETTLSNMLQQCLTLFATYIDSELFGIWNFNKDKRTLELESSTGFNTTIGNFYSRITIGSGLVGHVGQVQQPYLTNTLDKDLLISGKELLEKELLEKELLTAFAGYPLIVCRKLIGVLAIFSKKPLLETTFQALLPTIQILALGLEHRQVQQQVSHSNILLNYTQDIAIVIDLEDQIIFWNKTAEKYYGWAMEEVIGKNISDLLYKNSFQQIKAKTVTMQQGRWQGEVNQKQKDGKEIITQNQWTLTNNESGKPISICIVANDITEKKKLASQSIKAQRIEILGTMARGIAHDLNNVFSPIIISTDVLKMRTKDEKSQEILQTLKKVSQQGVELAKQLLTFTRSIEGRFSTIQLRYIVIEISKLIKESFPKSIELHTYTPADTWNISGDFTQIHQVLVNLCDNARDAMPNGGVLTITLENVFINENDAFKYSSVNSKVGYYVVITIADTGIGIAKDVIDKIFDQFFTTKETVKDSGRGLYIAQNIIENHLGFFHVDSELNKGTIFKIYLPAIVSSESTSPEKQEINPLAGKGEMILVVDDEAAISDTIAKTLEAFNYRVITAADGREAITLYLRNRNEIKLVLTDMIMPVMNGVELIKLLQGITPDIKVIITSGGPKSEIDKEIDGLDIKNFLPKPFTAEILLELILVTLKY